MLQELWEDLGLFWHSPWGMIYCSVLPIGLLLIALMLYLTETALMKRPLQILYLWAVSYAIFWGFLAIGAIPIMIDNSSIEGIWFILALGALVIGGPYIMLIAVKRAFSCTGEQAAGFHIRWLIAVAILCVLCFMAIPNT